MIEILIPVLVLGVVLPALGFLIALPFWIREFVDFRRTIWIAAAPRMIPVDRGQLPSSQSALVGEIEPVLRELGFDSVVMAHASAFGLNATWTQVLFLNRSRGERASVGCFIEGEVATLGLTLVSEFADGTRVESDARDLPGRHAKPLGAEGGATAELTRRLYELHGERRDQSPAFQANKEPVMPQAGQELAWMESKAAIIAALFASGRFELNESKDYYRPTRSYALKLVLRDFKAVPRRRVRREARGFPIRPADQLLRR